VVKGQPQSASEVIGCVGKPSDVVMGVLALCFLHSVWGRRQPLSQAKITHRRDFGSRVFEVEPLQAFEKRQGHVSQPLAKH
jgi:hypothetical protein